MGGREFLLTHHPDVALVGQSLAAEAGAASQVEQELGGAVVGESQELEGAFGERPLDGDDAAVIRVFAGLSVVIEDLGGSGVLRAVVPAHRRAENFSIRGCSRGFRVHALFASS